MAAEQAIFGPGTEGGTLASGKQTMEGLLRKANAGLDYARDYQGTVRKFTDSYGVYNAKEWVPRLTKGVVGAMGVENPLASGDIVRGFQESAGNLFTDLANRGSQQAGALFAGTLSNALIDKFGVPPGLVRPAVQAAQAAVTDALGMVGTKLLASAGAALGPFSGGLSIVGGGLLSMALGGLFGDEEPPAPLPAEKVRTVARPTTIVEMDAVWEEVFTTVVRWRRQEVRYARRTRQIHDEVQSLNTNYFYLPEEYWSETRITRNKNYATSGKDASTYGPLGTPMRRLAAQEAWLGGAIPWTVEGLDNYRFIHDALGPWIGYNRNLSLAVQRSLGHAFSLEALGTGISRTTKAPFEPYFAEIGWAEWIVNGIVAAAWREMGERTPWVGEKWAHPNLIGVMRWGNQKFAGHRGAKNLRSLAKNWATDSAGALALVTEQIRASMAVGEGFAQHSATAEQQTLDLKIVAEEERRTMQQTILSSVTGEGAKKQARELVIEIDRARKAQDEEDKKIRRAGIPWWAIPVGLGVVGAGAWVFSRRR